ncbi:hypothetical protein SYNTR_1986 [Candidatus Syntrophocurvum alkaliphilum]|uniref:Uncharacterized protein n=2 Tax=Candidatus Syntrophocurvum alkaliphilum TaxID=2293317 RepID=A0A6I6DL27_9FIRM|nr:hypothetical protein SYNTR_1986 [Candidatus Syntrophocurvum alkaliphilum]
MAVLEKEIIDSDKEKAPKIPPLEKAQIIGERYENLSLIYQEGYHICPMAYGEPRYGECLFCSGYLEKE